MKTKLLLVMSVLGILAGCASNSPCCQQNWYAPSGCTSCGQQVPPPPPPVVTAYQMNYVGGYKGEAQYTRTIYTTNAPAPVVTASCGSSCGSSSCGSCNKAPTYDCGSSCVHWRTGCWAHYACNSYENNYNNSYCNIGDSQFSNNLCGG